MLRRTATFYNLALLAINLTLFGLYPRLCLLSGSIPFLATFTLVTFLISTVFVVLFKKNFFSLFLMFNALFFCFIYGKLVVGLVYGWENLFLLNTFFTAIFSPCQIFEVILVANISVNILHTIYFARVKRLENLEKPRKEFKNYRPLIFMLVLFGGLFLFKSLLDFKYVLEHGYKSIYIGGLENVNYYSPIVKYSHIIFYAFYYYLISLVPSKKIFVRFSSLYLLLSFMDSLKGARVLFVMPMLFVFWYYFNVYQSKNQFTFGNFLKITVGGIALLIGLQLASGLRRKGAEAQPLAEVVVELPYHVLNETGKTLQLVALYNTKKEKLKDPYKPFVLEPILFPYLYFKDRAIMTGGQSKELVDMRHYLNGSLTYEMNSVYYKGGGGLGSTFVAENYEYGLIYLIGMSVLMGSLIVWFLNNLQIRILLSLSPIIVKHIVFVARETPFINLFNIVKFMSMFLIVTFFFKIIDALRTNQWKPQK